MSPLEGLSLGFVLPTFPQFCKSQKHVHKERFQPLLQFNRCSQHPIPVLVFTRPIPLSPSIRRGALVPSGPISLPAKFSSTMAPNFNASASSSQAETRKSMVDLISSPPKEQTLPPTGSEDYLPPKKADSERRTVSFGDSMAIFKQIASGSPTLL